MQLAVKREEIDHHFIFFQAKDSLNTSLNYISMLQINLPKLFISNLNKEDDTDGHGVSKLSNPSYAP